MDVHSISVVNVKKSTLLTVLIFVIVKLVSAEVCTLLWHFLFLLLTYCLYLCSLLISLSIHFISDCNNFTKQTCLTTKRCKWVDNGTCTKCSSIDEQRDKFEECNSCLKYESGISCGGSTDGCEWCQGMYCTRNGKCEIKCELYATKKECSEVSVKCSWCLSTDSCIDNDAKCNDCSLYSEAFCPRGCNCSANTLNLLAVLIPIIAAGVVAIVVLTILGWFFVLRRRRAQGNNGIAMSSLTAKQLTFDPEFCGESAQTGSPASGCTQGDISPFVSCSVDSISFGKPKAPLLLDNEYDARFKVTNRTKEVQTIKLFAGGFSERHRITFAPQEGLEPTLFRFELFRLISSASAQRHFMRRRP